jgi:2-deoxy-D-gluconate 3-dehydrogenase
MGSHLNAFTMEGKVSIVTGGGRGIGLGIARALAGAGSDLGTSGAGWRSSPAT